MAIRRKVEPVHKVFYLCSSYAPDTAWAEFFRDCSFGKFPRGVRFEDGAIKCTRKKQTFVEHLPKDPEKAFEVILEVFRDRLNIKTSREKKSANIKFDKKKEETRIQCWKDASTIGAKTSLIRNYVDQLAQYYRLNISERQEMLSLLEIGITTKMIDGSKIKVQDGKIYQIEGLLFDPFTRQISFQGQCPPPPSTICPVPLDYVPVAQSNHGKQYFDLISHHYEKTQVAKG